jgi:hypothetical protein
MLQSEAEQTVPSQEAKSKLSKRVQPKYVEAGLENVCVNRSLQLKRSSPTTRVCFSSGLNSSLNTIYLVQNILSYPILTWYGGWIHFCWRSLGPAMSYSITPSLGKRFASGSSLFMQTPGKPAKSTPRKGRKGHLYIADINHPPVTPEEQVRIIKRRIQKAERDERMDITLAMTPVKTYVFIPH